MSPGATFERVYHELKRMLAEGELPPGTPIEPAIIGKQIASSITPIRDALHRLTGERLVEAPNHNGFRVPLLTEAALRDLYRWSGQLLSLALKGTRHDMPGPRSAIAPPGGNLAAQTATLFIDIAQTTGNAEHIASMALTNDRLAPFRRVEAELLEGTAAELQSLTDALGDRARLLKLLASYHQRRIKIVPTLLTSSLLTKLGSDSFTSGPGSRT